MTYTRTPVASGTSGAVAVEDEGTQVVASASRLNFAGAGVAATDAGGGVVTISVSGAALTTEEIQDIVGAMATDGTTVNFTYDDVAGTLTAEVQGLTSASISNFAEAVDDRVAALLVAGSNVTLTYDDVAGTLTIAAAGGTVDVVSNVAADRVLGRVTAGPGDSEELTAAQVKTLLGAGAASGLGTLDANARQPLAEVAQAYAARAYRDATALSIPNNTETAVDLTSESFDYYGMHDTVTNPSRITVGRAGVYDLVAGLRYASNSTGMRQLIIKKNGIDIILNLGVPGINGDVTRIGGTTQIDLVANDYVELIAFQSSGGALSLSFNDFGSNYLALTWTGPLT